MVMSFFRRGDTGLARINAQIVGMVTDARHSFDVATLAILQHADVNVAADDIHSTDRRINRAEHEVRRELIVHISVHGTADIGLVLGMSLLVKKIERIGDQAKNIMDLALEGVTLVGAEDVDQFHEAQQIISALFAEVAALVADPDRARAEDIRDRADQRRAYHERCLRELLHSNAPGHWAVPRAVLHRYLKRIVANLQGVALTITDPDRDLPDGIE
jgi:phosphate uptake regulator